MVKKVGRAYEQIDVTAELIEKDRPKTATIPRDRPLRGLVVTLEPFHMVNTIFFDDVLERPSTPTLVVSAHELEGTLAVLQNAPDTGARLLTALTPSNGLPSGLSKAASDLANIPNPLLREAWNRFSAPWDDVRNPWQGH